MCTKPRVHGVTASSFYASSSDKCLLHGLPETGQSEEVSRAGGFQVGAEDAHDANPVPLHDV